MIEPNAVAANDTQSPGRNETTSPFCQGLGATVLLLICSGCASGGQEVPLPPQTVTPGAADPTTPGLVKELPPELSGASQQSNPDASQASGSSSSSAKPSTTDRSSDGSLLILGQTGAAPGETTNRDLVEASRRERERRLRTQPVAVIDDENLAQEAIGGNLTVGTPRQVDPEELAQARETLDDFAEKELYWRDRAREIRVRFRNAFDSIEDLEADAADWRRKFYESEDKAYRDREIKPAWDRAQDRVTEARSTIDNVRDELDLLYQEGRYDGALDGWLREGIELEPWPEELEDMELRRDQDEDPADEGSEVFDRPPV